MEENNNIGKNKLEVLPWGVWGMRKGHAPRCSWCCSIRGLGSGSDQGLPAACPVPAQGEVCQPLSLPSRDQEGNRVRPGATGNHHRGPLTKPVCDRKCISSPGGVPRGGGSSGERQLTGSLDNLASPLPKCKWPSHCRLSQPVQDALSHSALTHCQVHSTLA